LADNEFRLAVLVFRCRNQTALEYLARELQWAVEVESRRRLRSASSQRLVVRWTRLSWRSCLQCCCASFMEQPACRRCRFSVADNFRERLKIFLFEQSNWPLTPADFVSPVLAGIRQAKYHHHHHHHHDHHLFVHKDAVYKMTVCNWRTGHARLVKSS